MDWANRTMLMMVVLMATKATAFTQEEEDIEHFAESSLSSDEINTNNINEMGGIGFFKKYNINNISANELEGLSLLTPVQIQAFLVYRNSIGHFISLMELQAVPRWDVFTVRKILPMLTLDVEQPLGRALKQRIKEGEQKILYRTGRKLNRLPENTDTLNQLNQQLISYRFNVRNMLRFGITVEKDAGEKNPLDHFSLFASIGKHGLLKNLVLGDYTVNMGQGLVHWQGFALGRSSNLMSCYRQGELFRPHTGTDENRFCRGMAFQLQKKSIEFGGFISNKKIDANTMTDTSKQEIWVSSILSSGLHRTKGEMEDKKSLKQFMAGGNIRWSSKMGKSSLNFIHTLFDLPVKKRALPYNRFAINGTNWINASVDHAVSTRIGFLFTEFAVDKHLQKALIAGLIKSIDPKVDISMLYRNMGMRFRSLESNVFSERQEAGNEKGFFFNLNFMPSPKHRLEVYCDMYRQDWPTFNNPGKKTGTVYSIQYAWRPDKKTDIYGRLQWEDKTHKIRIHASITPINSIVLRIRNEMIRTRNEAGIIENGHFAYAELIAKPALQPISGSIRCAWFDTDGYSSRIYAYERDVPNYYAVSPHHGKGVKTYAVLQYKMGNLLQLCGKWSMERKRNEWRVQAILQWGS